MYFTDEITQELQEAAADAFFDTYAKCKLARRAFDRVEGVADGATLEYMLSILEDWRWSNDTSYEEGVTLIDEYNHMKSALTWVEITIRTHLRDVFFYDTEIPENPVSPPVIPDPEPEKPELTAVFAATWEMCEFMQHPLERVSSSADIDQPFLLEMFRMNKEFMHSHYKNLKKGEITVETYGKNRHVSKLVHETIRRHMKMLQWKEGQNNE